MKAYINGIGNISPQNTFRNDLFLEEPIVHEGRILHCVEPDYKEFVNPVQIRRMGRIIKMGIASAKTALKDAGIEKPDAIISGTGLGCLEDTEKFLLNMIESNETGSAPTQFISSTHNSVSAQIALQIKCLGYNFTYVHKGFSFISALQDSLLQLEFTDAQNVLCGATDEHIQTKFEHYDLIGWWKKEIQNNLELFSTPIPGTISGEGSHFFVIGKEKSENSYAKINGIKQIYGEYTPEQSAAQAYEFIIECGLLPQDIDIFISGMNGDEKIDQYSQTIAQKILPEAGQVVFKHLCGEYYTSDAFGFWLGANILKKQEVPEITKFNTFEKSEIKRTLIYNNSQGNSQVLYMLEAC